MQAVVMAGGRGERLLPAMESVPKPVVTVGARPILAWTLEGLANRGFTQVFLCVGRSAEIFREKLLGYRPAVLELTYVTEDQPMGTMGALTLCELDPARSCLVLNGDVLTTLDFGAFLKEHATRGEDWTIATHQAVYRARFGEVLTDEAGRLTEYREKPARTTRFSSGVYAVSPKARAWLSRQEEQARAPLPDLLRAMAAAGLAVVGRDHESIWVDINDPDDLTIARRELDEERLAAVAGRSPAPARPGEPRFGERGWTL